MKGRNFALSLLLVMAGVSSLFMTGCGKDGDSSTPIPTATSTIVIPPLQAGDCIGGFPTHIQVIPCDSDTPALHVAFVTSGNLEQCPDSTKLSTAISLDPLNVLCLDFEGVKVPWTIPSPLTAP